MATIMNVHSDMDPKDINDALLTTFQKWVQFALGTGKLGGQMLRHPSGRLASAIKAEHDQEGNVIAIYIDPEAEDELVKISGHKAFSLKNRLLREGKPGTKRSAAGYLYRYVPISNVPKSPRKAYNDRVGNWIKNMFTGTNSKTGGTISINKNLAKMWASEWQRSRSSVGGGYVRTMTNNPKSKATWRIPAMPTYSVKRLLRQMVPSRIKDRIIL